MELHIIAVGKITESYVQKGIDEFITRLQRHAEVKTTEVKAEKINGNLSSAEMEQVKEQEADRIKDQINKRSYVIALDPHGKPMTSEGLAKSIGNLQVQGYSSIQFIIGGTLGLHTKIRELADYVLTFSHMTFTHEMIRLILLEQVYRAFKIMKGEPYHH
ncbi:23S rRNA (pseudouridine(1915)-N(3))-methyltransferase RlmH [Halanaerobaculum tunisiense]